MFAYVVSSSVCGSTFAGTWRALLAGENPTALGLLHGVRVGWDGGRRAGVAALQLRMEVSALSIHK